MKVSNDCRLKKLVIKNSNVANATKRMNEIKSITKDILDGKTKTGKSIKTIDINTLLTSMLTIVGEYCCVENMHNEDVVNNSLKISDFITNDKVLNEFGLSGRIVILATALARCLTEEEQLLTSLNELIENKEALSIDDIDLIAMNTPNVNKKQSKYIVDSLITNLDNKSEEFIKIVTKEFGNIANKTSFDSTNYKKVSNNKEKVINTDKEKSVLDEYCKLVKNNIITTEKLFTILSTKDFEYVLTNSKK